MDKANITLHDFLVKYSGMPSNKIARFKDYYSCTLKEFVGKSLSNKVYRVLQEQCVDFVERGRMNDDTLSKPSDAFKGNPIFEVPFIPELLDLILPSDVANKLNCVKQQSFQRMIELLDVDYNVFSSWKNAGPSKWNYFMEVKKLLSTDEGQDKVLDAYNCCFVSHCFPEILNENESLGEKIEAAFRQYISYLEKISQYKHSLSQVVERIKLIFLERHSREELAKLLSLTTERVRQLNVGYLDNIINGTWADVSNLSLDNQIKQEISSFLEHLPAICSKKYLEELLQVESYENSIVSVVLPLQSAPQNINSLSKAPYLSFDQVYYTSTKESLSWVGIYINSICGVLGLNSKIFDVRPMTIDDIMDLLEQSVPEFEFDRDVVLDLLQQHDWIEQLSYADEVKYQLKYQYLKTDYKYLARIVYENKRVNINDIDVIHRTKMNDFRIPSIQNSVGPVKKNISWVVNGGKNGILEYNENGETKIKITEFIKQWVAERILFTMQDILQALEKEGYMNLVENTIRTYVMNHCHVDNKQRNLFCYSPCIDQFSEYAWRSKAQSGITNWMIKKVREHLLNVSSMTLDIKLLADKLQKDAQESDEKFQINRDLEMYLCRYAQEDFGLFEFPSKKTIRLTDKCKNLSDEELDKIGRRNRKPEYYDVVISKIVALLKESDNGEMRLLDLRGACLDDLENKADTAFYKIVDNYLPKQIVKIKKGDKLFLKLQKEKIEYVDSMTVRASENAGIPVIVKDEIERPVREFGQKIPVDWNVLRKDFCFQLGFYVNQWNLDLSFEEGVDKFIRFIQRLDTFKNMRLTRQLPQSFMLFWHYQNDNYAFMDYLTGIVTCYERLLREIHLANTGDKLESVGLMSTVKMIESMSHWASGYDTNIFHRIFRNIRTERNKISHGEEFVSRTLPEMVLSITQYIALYIYTVARFWEEK